MCWGGPGVLERGWARAWGRANLCKDLVKVRTAVAGRGAQAGERVLALVVVDDDVAHLRTRPHATHLR